MQRILVMGPVRRYSISAKETRPRSPKTPSCVVLPLLQTSLDSGVLASDDVGQDGGWERSMRRIAAWLGLALGGAGILIAIAQGAETGRLIFLSTQLRPIEEAQKMRNLILKS